MLLVQGGGRRLLLRYLVRKVLQKKALNSKRRRLTSYIRFANQSQVVLRKRKELENGGWQAKIRLVRHLEGEMCSCKRRGKGRST